MKIWEFDKNTFAEDLKNLRLDAQMSQRDLADRVPFCSQYSIAKYEAGEYLPNMTAVIGIAQALGIDEVRINISKR